MLIAASLTVKPRAERFCTSHNSGVCREGHLISGPAVRLYGAAHRGDLPYVLWLCLPAAQEALETWADPAAKAKLKSTLARRHKSIKPEREVEV